MTSVYLEPIQADDKYKLTKEDQILFTNQMSQEISNIKMLYYAIKKININCDMVLLGNNSLKYSILYHLLLNK